MSCECGCEKSPHPDFRYTAILERMLDRISRAGPLATLGRELDDPAVALLAATAGVHHVLAWNLRRLAVDATLTGTEDREALLRITAMVGYVPRPAIAAAALLAFHVGDLPGAPQIVTVPAGTQVAAIPEQGGRPETFETDADAETRAAWNTLRPHRALVPTEITEATTIIEVAGIDFGGRASDRVLVHAEGTSWLVARVTAVDIAVTATPPRTLITLAAGELLEVSGDVIGPVEPGTVILFGQHAQPFGATAPKTDMASKPEKGPAPEWANFTVDPTRIHLDAVYPQAAPGKVALFETELRIAAPRETEPDTYEIAFAFARMVTVTETARADFGLSARCTLITVDPPPAGLGVRTTVVHIETARGLLLSHPENSLLPKSPDRLHVIGDATLPPGRRVILKGEDTGGEAVTEAAVVLRTEPADPGTVVVFDRPLACSWTAATLEVLANVVAATHTRSSPSGPEIIGSGDPSVALPGFPLTRHPLAHVAAPGPRGYSPAIEVDVAGRRYDHAETLYGEAPDSRRYATVALPDGTWEVRFAGRLPTGTGNVVAGYRTGGGAAGNLGAGRLTQLLTPVVGVDRVVNPLPAEGGSDAATIEEVRTAAPKSIRTLDRVVSLSDVEAFAQEYRGIGKATAIELRARLRRVVCLTVATTSLRPLVPGSDLLLGLHDAITAAAPPGTHLLIGGFEDLEMRVVLEIVSDPTLARAAVETAVKTALERAFGRAARPFGGAVHRSQIVATAQDVSGVVAVRLLEWSATGVTEDAEGRLRCPDATLTVDPATGVSRFEPARLLALSPSTIEIKEAVR